MTPESNSDDQLANLPSCCLKSYNLYAVFRCVREIKVKTKISGGFRTLQGAADFARLRSVISSARKQGLNIRKALILGPERLAVELKL